ncbi:MAG: retropepsin-like aspartic protease [Syntrophotaleaceae bacterium]
MDPNLSTTVYRQQRWVLSLLQLAFLTGLLILPLFSHGEVHRYVDEHGSAVFVDDAYLSPAERRDLQQKVLDSEKAKHESPTTPVEILGNQVLLPVELSDGHRQIRGRLLLDTGASQTVFHRRAIEPLHTRVLGKGWSRLAGGQQVATDLIRFESLRVGPHTWENPTVYVIELQGPDVPFDGLLGMDFLKAHPYRIDFQQQMLLWHPAD